MQLQCAAYCDAADQAELSHLYGGIHIAADELTGRRTGAKIGQAAFDRCLNLPGVASSAPVAAPAIVRPPAAVATSADRTAQLAVEVGDTGPVSFQARPPGRHPATGWV